MKLLPRYTKTLLNSLTSAHRLYLQDVLIQSDFSFTKPSYRGRRSSLSIYEDVGEWKRK